MTYLFPKSIGEIMQESVHFWIPSYQRGYRWTSVQVSELLDDVWEFHRADPRKDEYYWLQPIAVKQCANGIEVIDGQQRLTTVLLIVKYIQTLIPLFEGEGYSLSYETRTGSEQYIVNIKEGVSKQNDNIDYYHMYNAYKTIEKWFTQHTERNAPIHMWQRLTDQVKVIWYELDTEYDGIELFTRINIGKIPLTNAELIKALFLSKNNLGSNNEQHELIRMKQLELATQWDTMEIRLQNPDIWYFLQSNEVDYKNHIEWLFEVVTSSFSSNSENHTSLRTFHAFHEEIERRVSQGSSRYKVVESIWSEIHALYLQVNEWFDNRELFHLIGYLLATGQSVHTILNQSKAKKKDEFVNALYGLIRNYIKNWDVYELSYETDRQKIKQLLLLYNILTLQKDRFTKQRFDFDRFKNEQWDIEHIHAVHSQPFTKQDEQLSFIRDALSFIDDSSLRERLEQTEVEIINMTIEAEVFEKIQQEIIDYFGEGYTNNISNCTLLDSKTNRSYKNAIFPKKREIIISRDQNGVYIPICTKNVFLKYYSKQTKQIHHWNQEDREAYLQNIIEILSPVITNQRESQVG